MDRSTLHVDTGMLLDFGFSIAASISEPPPQVTLNFSLSLITFSSLISEDFWVFLPFFSAIAVLYNLQQICRKYCDRWENKNRNPH